MTVLNLRHRMKEVVMKAVRSRWVAPTSLWATSLVIAAAAPLANAAAAAGSSTQAATAAAPLATLEALRAKPGVLVRSPVAGGPLTWVSFDPATREVRTRQPLALACERLHVGGGALACLRYNRALSGASQLDVFDFALTRTQESPIQSNSIISRTRVSTDGRHVGTTVFVSGHSYAVPGQFSTMSHIWDARERRMALSLDKLRLMHEGELVPYTPRTQLNYWGITFDPNDSDRFFLTVSIRKRPYLAEGRVSLGTATTVRADVECPSFSPDGKRLAFKKLRENKRGWDPAVLELASGQERIFPAAGGVDDQIEWLDNDTLLYEATETRMGGADTHLMVRNVRESASPERLWLKDAASPAVYRGR